MVVTIYSDAGHAWAKVKKALLDRLGIAKDISQFSYQRDVFAYLEEDNDLAILCSALRKHNRPVTFNERKAEHRPSKIRQYEAYTA